jgi:predicted membrane protein
VVVVDDVRVTNRISASISAFGFLVSVMLFVFAVREYRSGASVLWLVAGFVIFFSALYTLVRDVWRLRTEPTV